MSKIIFELVLQDVNAQQAIAKFRQEVKDANAEIKKGVGADRFKELTEKITAAKIETLKLTDEQKKLRKEFAATQVPTDSLAGLRIAYAQVTEQVRILSKAERESDFGKSLIKRGASIKSQIDGIEQSLGRFTGNVGNYKSAISSITGIFAAAGIGLGVSELIGATREFEKLFAVLKQVTGNEAAAQKVFSDIQQFAKETPFQINELVGAFVKLENRNFNPTIEQLRIIGDIAASSGKTVDQFTEAILDAATGEFERLKEFGIVARKNGDDLRVSFRGQSETFKNTTENITKYLLKIGELPGIQGSAVAVSKTLDGSISNLKDNFTQLAANIGGTGGILKTFVDFLNSAIEVVNDFVGTPLSEKLEEQKSSFNALIGVLQDTTTAESERNEVIQTLKREYPGYLQFVNDDVDGQLDLAKTLDFGNSLFEKRILLQATEEQRTKLVRERIKLEQELTEALTDQQKASTIGAARRPSARNEAADLGSVNNVRAQAERDVLFIRESIRSVSDELANLTKNADDTALRTTGKTLAELSAEINNLDKKDKKISDAVGFGKEEKDKIEAVNGSLLFLRDQIADLKKELENTPPDSPLFKKLIGNIREAETALARLEELVKTALDPSDIGTGIIDTSDSIRIPVTLEVVDEDKTAKQIDDFLKRINKKARENKAASDAEQAEIDAARREDLEEAIKEAALDTAQAISNGLFEIQRNRQEKEKNEALSALDAETAKKIEQAQGNAALITQIEKDADKKRAAIEKEAAQRAKSIALKQAAIDTALSILKALSSAVPPFNFILAGAAAVAGAIQLAVIKKQEFAGGGRVKKLGSGIINEQPNHPRTAKGDNVLALVKSGEMILNEEQQARLESIAGRGIYGRIGVPLHGVTSKLVPQFAGGGFATDFTPQIALPQGGAGQAIVVQTVAEISDEQMNMLAARIAAQTGRATKEGVGEGLEDNNRLQERQAALTKNREA